MAIIRPGAATAHQAPPGATPPVGVQAATVVAAVGRAAVAEAEAIQAATHADSATSCFFFDGPKNFGAVSFWGFNSEDAICHSESRLRPHLRLLSRRDAIAGRQR